MAYVNKCVRYLDTPDKVLEYAAKSPDNNFYAPGLLQCVMQCSRAYLLDGRHDRAVSGTEGYGSPRNRNAFGRLEFEPHLDCDMWSELHGRLRVHFLRFVRRRVTCMIRRCCIYPNRYRDAFI